MPSPNLKIPFICVCSVLCVSAIKNEALQQKQTLSKQREEYSRKSTMISRELQLLKDQEQELRAENSRDNERILRENNKLQVSRAPAAQHSDPCHMLRNAA